MNLDTDTNIEVEIVDDGSTLPGEENNEEPSPAEFKLAELLGEPIIDEDDPETEEFYKNLAEDISDSALATLAGDLVGEFEGDVS